MIKNLIKNLLNRPGVLGYLSSLIYFTYGGGWKAGYLQAKNRQGFDLFYGVDTFNLPSSDEKWAENLTSSDSKWAVDSTSDKVERIEKGINFITDQHASPSECTFIDFGCGKGRALIVASKQGFSSLVGIELSPYAMTVCQNNLKKLSISCSVLSGSIRDVDFSDVGEMADNIVIYAYNPTALNIIVDACENVIRSYPNRKIFLIYTNPQGQILTDMISMAQKIFHDHKLDVYRLS